MNRWIRTEVTSNEGKRVVGLAGRRGFIQPVSRKEFGAKYQARTYDLRETHYADCQNDLKKLLDGEPLS